MRLIPLKENSRTLYKSMFIKDLEEKIKDDVEDIKEENGYLRKERCRDKRRRLSIGD